MRVYQFGARRPTEGFDAVLVELRRANDYYNVLIEIENGRRAAIQAVVGDDERVREMDAAYKVADERAAELARVIKQERVARRGRVVGIATAEKYRGAQQERAVVVALRAHARRASRIRHSDERHDEHAHPSDGTFLVGDYKAARDGSRHDKRTEAKLRKKKEAAQGLTIDVLAAAPITLINMRAHELCINARKYKTVYSGTSLRIEDAVQQAKKPPPVDMRPLGWSPLDPLKFRRFGGEGSLGPQIQMPEGSVPFATAKLFNATDTRVQIARVPWRNGPRRLCSKRTERRKGDVRTFAVLKIRIASDAARNPVWAVCPLLLHREIPDGVVKWVTLSRRMIGPREQWSCEITVDEAPTAPVCGTGGTVAVHCGWYVDPDQGGRLRVANVLDERGRAEQLFQAHPTQRAIRSAQKHAMPVLDGFEYAEKIRSIRARGFDAVKAALVQWIDAHVAKVPEWLRAETKWVAKWRTPAKLSRLLARWSTARFDGDADAFLGAQWWIRRCDQHHWGWERSQEASAQRRRRDHYRTFAATLAKRYSTLVVDDTDYRALARKTRPDGVALTPGLAKRQDGSEAHVTKEDAVQEHRRRAASGEMRAVLINAFRSRGGTVVKVKAANGSIECPECHAASAAHRVDPHYFACAECGFESEIDTVFLVNALRRAGIDVTEIVARLKRSRPFAAE